MSGIQDNTDRKSESRPDSTASTHPVDNPLQFILVSTGFAFHLSKE